MYVCMYVCMFVCLYLCGYNYIFLYIDVCIWIIHDYHCIRIDKYIYIYICIYVYTCTFVTANLLTSSAPANGRASCSDNLV